MSGVPGADLKLLLISDSILNPVAAAAHDVTTEQKSPCNSQTAVTTRPGKKNEAEDQGTGMKCPLESLPNEIIIMLFKTLSGEDKLASDGRVCLALTSKRLAQLAVQVGVQLPTRLSFGEKWFNSSRRDREVQREDVMVVTAPHHELMVALRQWLPAKMLYCAYCGTWKISCRGYGICSPIIVSARYLSGLITANGNPHICRTCHIKGTARLPPLGLVYDMIMLAEQLGSLRRKLEQIKLQIPRLADR